MKKRNLTVMFAAVLVLAVLTLTSSNALASWLDEYEATLDCYGWRFNGSFYFGPEHNEAEIRINVRLYENGALLFDETYWPGVVLKEDPTFDFSGLWGRELCGDITVAGTFHYRFDGGSWTDRQINAEFYCECNGDDFGCTYTPGYWKTHPDAWPLDHMTLGGVHYNKAQLMQIFWTPPAGGDITVVLAHHLIAAKLNVASGADDSIQDTIDEADAYLEMYPLFSNPKGAAKAEGERIKDILCAYNELPCEEDYDDGMDMLTSKTASENLNAPAAATEEISWGALKKMQ